MIGPSIRLLAESALEEPGRRIGEIGNIHCARWLWSSVAVHPVVVEKLDEVVFAIQTLFMSTDDHRECGHPTRSRSPTGPSDPHVATT